MDATSRREVPSQRDLLDVVEAPAGTQGRERALPNLACPNLGLASDPVTFALFPTPEHRCLARRNYQPSMEQQFRFCLGAYIDCEDFRKRERAIATPLRKTSRFSLRLPIAGLGALVLLIAAVGAAGMRLAS